MCWPASIARHVVKVISTLLFLARLGRGWCLQFVMNEKGFDLDGLGLPFHIQSQSRLLAGIGLVHLQTRMGHTPTSLRAANVHVRSPVVETVLEGVLAEQIPSFTTDGSTTTPSALSSTLCGMLSGAFRITFQHFRRDLLLSPAPDYCTGTTSEVVAQSL